MLTENTSSFAQAINKVEYLEVAWFIQEVNPINSVGKTFCKKCLNIYSNEVILNWLDFWLILIFILINPSEMYPKC